MPNPITFTCPVAIRASQWNGPFFRVTSPSSGRTIEIGEAWLGQLTFHLRGRVAQAVSLHKPATFTRQELIELVELEKRQTAGRQREADRLRHYTPNVGAWSRR
jgi:hypothetical protein